MMKKATEAEVLVGMVALTHDASDPIRKQAMKALAETDGLRSRLRSLRARLGWYTRRENDARKARIKAGLTPEPSPEPVQTTLGGHALRMQPDGSIVDDWTPEGTKVVVPARLDGRMN